MLGGRASVFGRVGLMHCIRVKVRVCRRLHILYLDYLFVYVYIYIFMCVHFGSSFIFMKCLQVLSLPLPLK